MRKTALILIALLLYIFTSGQREVPLKHLENAGAEGKVITSDANGKAEWSDGDGLKQWDEPDVGTLSTDKTLLSESTGENASITSFLNLINIGAIHYTTPEDGYFWVKIGNIGINRQFVEYEIFINSNLNYPNASVFLLNASSYHQANYSSYSVSINAIALSEDTGDSLKTVITDAGDIWITCNARWMSNVSFRVIKMTSNVVINNDFTSSCKVINIPAVISEEVSNNEGKRFVVNSFPSATHIYKLKGLSTEDYTSREKTKLAGIENNAEKNIQPDFTQTNTSSDDYIKNNPFSVNGGVINTIKELLIEGEGRLSLESYGNPNTNPRIAAGGLDVLEWEGNVRQMKLPEYGSRFLSSMGTHMLTVDANGLVFKEAKPNNNFTSTYQTKLDGIANNAEVNVNPDWLATSGDGFILNKPIIPVAEWTSTSTNLSTSKSVTIGNGLNLSNKILSGAKELKLQGGAKFYTNNVNAVLTNGPGQDALEIQPNRGIKLSAYADNTTFLDAAPEYALGLNANQDVVKFEVPEKGWKMEILAAWTPTRKAIHINSGAIATTSLATHYDIGEVFTASTGANSTLNITIPSSYPVDGSTATITLTEHSSIGFMKVAANEIIILFQK